MRTERDRKAKSVNKKKKDIEEITLGSSSEEEDSDIDEVKSEQNDQEEPMDMDEPEPKPTIKENGVDSTSTDEQVTEEHITDDPEPPTPSEVNPVPNGSEATDEKMELSEPTENVETDTKTNTEELSKTEETTETTELKTDDIIQERLHPELKPGHVWSRQESAEIFKHLVPRVALVKLKNSKKYLKEMNKKHYDQDEQEVNKLRNLLKTNMVMQLANGVSAVVKPNGDTTVLPADYKEKIEIMEKKISRWKEESSWTPPKIGVAKKLNLRGIKLGRSIKQPKLILHRIDPE